MAAVLPESNSEVLEDKDDALLPESKVEDGEEFASLEDEDDKPEARPAKKPAVKKPAVDDADDDDIPVELKGKSPKELAKMYREAQSLIGRQGSELGEYRRKVDQFIQSSLAGLKPKKEDAPVKKDDGEIEETDFFAKPKDAIARAIENHPAIKEIRETLGKAAQDQAIARATANTERFNAAHPDAAQIMQDPEFRAWVGASKVRIALLKRAHEKFDFDSGDEVFGTWKALKGVGKKADDETVDDAAASAAAAKLAKRKQALKAVATPTGGGGGGKEPGSKKIYRRADVLKLMEEDPARYEALAPEIEQAYRENRVR